MASQQPVVHVIRELPPATLFAPLSVRTGASAPAEDVTVWLFDADTVKYLDFLCLLRGYAGGGLTFTVVWSAVTAITGNTLWSIAIRRLADDAEDIDVAHTYDYNNAAAAAAPTVLGEVSYDNITFTNGADMDNWANNEYAIVRVRRFATDGADSMLGGAELWDCAGLES